MISVNTMEKTDFYTKLKQEKIQPYQASLIGYKLYLLSLNDKISTDELDILIRDYKTRLSVWGLVDLLDRKFDYAIKIADVRNETIAFEEMFQLFSVCDEIFAMESLGLTFNVAKKQRYEKFVKNRIAKSKKVASIAAQKNMEPWNSNLWWYKEALK